MTRAKDIIVILAIAALVIASFAGGCRVGERNNHNLILRDTVVVTETITEDAPDPDTVWFERVVKIPVEIAKTDTLTLTKEIPVIVHDTIYLPISTSYYERLDGRLRMWVSGYQTELVRWELDEQTRLINCRKRWGFSAGIGTGVIYSPFTNRVDGGIGIFGGLTYTF